MKHVGLVSLPCILKILSIFLQDQSQLQLHFPGPVVRTASLLCYWPSNLPLTRLSTNPSPQPRRPPPTPDICFGSFTCKYSAVSNAELSSAASLSLLVREKQWRRVLAFLPHLPLKEKILVTEYLGGKKSLFLTSPLVSEFFYGYI